MFLSISILTTISLFIRTLDVTSFVVSNRHRHYTLTAGSVVLHIIVIVITILYFLFSINISMVTNIYSGIASGQALFNNESCVFQNHLSTGIGGDVFSVELALARAARKGFLKMLIHRWYRMLQPLAWVSWDSKSAQISQQGLVFLKGFSKWLYFKSVWPPS